MSLTVRRHDPAYWLKVYGRDPEEILEKGVPVTQDAYLEYKLQQLKLPREAFERFEGSNGCVAWAFAPGGAPAMTKVDELGQPNIHIDPGTVVVSWNPTIRSCDGKYYDFLLYESEKSANA